MKAQLITPALALLDRLPVDRRFLLFLVVGGLNTLFGYATFSLLVWLRLPYPLALLLAQIIGVLFNFRTTGRIVFANRDNRLLVKFFGVYALLYLINLGLLKLLLTMSLSVYVASALLILPMALLSFALNKKFVFTRTA